MPDTFNVLIKVIQIRKKSTKIDFLGPETARWGGGLPRTGVVAENFVPALESLSSLGFEGGIWDVPGILPGCPGPLGIFKKFVPKKFVRIFRSLVMRAILSVRPKCSHRFVSEAKPF